MNQYDSIVNLEQEKCVLVWGGAVNGNALLERQGEVDAVKWRSLGRICRYALARCTNLDSTRVKGSTSSILVE